MSEIPGDLKFLKSHEWARVEDSGRITVGISDHAQGLLGDLVYVELPQLGTRVSRGANCAVVESTKAAAEVYAPVTGEIVAANTEVSATPGQVNEAPYGKGWLFKIRLADRAELEGLLARDAYAKSAGV